MSTTTSKPARQPTLKQLHAAAKATKRWKEFSIEHNPKLPDEITRGLYRVANETARKVIEKIKTELNESRFKNLLQRMTAAAKFVCDVDGDDPSIPELKAVVADAERRQALIDEQNELSAAIKQRVTYMKRWRLCSISRTIPCFPVATVEFEADTAAELMEKIQEKGGAE